MPDRPAPTRFDLALAAALALLGVIEVAVPLSTVMGEGSPVVAGALACLSGLALAARRPRPLAVLVVVMAPTAALALVGPVLVLLYGGLVPMAVAVYSVARHGRFPEARLGAAIAALVVAVLVGTDTLDGPDQVVFPTLVLATSWVVGRVIRRHHHLATSSQERAREVEATSREETLAALAEERTRIARELHDIVAHTVTAIVVQAGAAREVVEEDPDYVRASLDRIRQTGSEALDEMRRVVALLREPGDLQPIDPQPGLADLGRLVDRSSSETTHVRLDVEGSPRPLPPGADLAAYRIVQEALTNVRRHADARQVRVTVRYRPSSVEIEVLDDGRGPQAGGPAPGHGHGLIGMRERLAMYGGALQAAPEPGAGFVVRATLPMEALT